jgi:hypothetical protein
VAWLAWVTSTPPSVAIDNKWPTGAVDLECHSARTLTDGRPWYPSSAPGINTNALQDDVIERAVTACADTVPTTTKAF